MIEKLYTRINEEIKKVGDYLKLDRALDKYPITRLPTTDPVFAFKNRMKTISEVLVYFETEKDNLTTSFYPQRISHSLTRLKEFPVSKQNGAVCRWNEFRQQVEYVPYFNLELSIGTSFRDIDELTDLPSDGFVRATTASFESTNLDFIFKDRIYEHTGGEVDMADLLPYTYVYLQGSGEHIFNLIEEPDDKIIYIINTDTENNWVKTKGLSEFEGSPVGAHFLTFYYSTGNSQYLNGSIINEARWFYEGE